jgi:16S rRNA (cytosine967-C5)-methyltransferase
MAAFFLVASSLVTIWPAAAAFHNAHKLTHTRIRICTSHRRFAETTLRSTTADGGKKTSRPAKSNNVKPSVVNKAKPTSRSVAIAALANAAASTYQSCSQAGAGAEVNAGSFATRQLEQDNYYKLLDPRDRAFARLLVATVQRRLGQIDGVLDCCVDKNPSGKNRHLVQATLRVGAAQLLFLKKPTFAVVKETVEVLRIHHKLSYSSKSSHVPEPMIKFVNGVLRKLSRKDEDTDEMYALKLLDEKTSSRDNIAPWLLESWERDWGIETTKLICEEIMPRDERSITPHIDLTTKYSAAFSLGLVDETKDNIDSLVEKLGDDSMVLPQGSIRVLTNGDVRSWADFDQGTWWVQDCAATLPGMVLTKALYDKHSCDVSNLRVVDMCAAPGGKTSQLLSAGFEHVTAIEANPRRCHRLKQNLQRLKFDKKKYDVVVEEGQNWMPQNKVDGILVDVPCSATGTGSRRPDVLRRDSDISELLDIQEVLANHCAEILPVGGIMVYATCSLLKEESEAQVKKLVEKGLVETLPIRPFEVPGFEDAIDENGWMRVIPGVLDGELRSADGFFAARLIKK